LESERALALFPLCRRYEQGSFMVEADIKHLFVALCRYVALFYPIKGSIVEAHYVRAVAAAGNCSGCFTS
jgi:hypothetical protein